MSPKFIKWRQERTYFLSWNRREVGSHPQLMRTGKTALVYVDKGENTGEHGAIGPKLREHRLPHSLLFRKKPIDSLGSVR